MGPFVRSFKWTGPLFHAVGFKHTHVTSSDRDEGQIYSIIVQEWSPISVAFYDTHRDTEDFCFKQPDHNGTQHVIKPEQTGHFLAKTGIVLEKYRYKDWMILFSRSVMKDSGCTCKFSNSASHIMIVAHGLSVCITLFYLNMLKRGQS